MLLNVALVLSFKLPLLLVYTFGTCLKPKYVTHSFTMN
jgi:hypothetical protein